MVRTCTTRKLLLRPARGSLTRAKSLWRESQLRERIRQDAFGHLGEGFGELIRQVNVSEDGAGLGVQFRTPKTVEPLTGGHSSPPNRGSVLTAK